VLRGQRNAPAALYPRERPGTHFTEGCVGPRAGLDRWRKSCPPLGLDPRTVQYVVSHYKDWATWPTLWPIQCHSKECQWPLNGLPCWGFTSLGMKLCHWVSGYWLSEGQLQGSGSTTRILNLKHNKHQVLSVPLICMKNCNILRHIYNILFFLHNNLFYYRK